MKHVQHCVHSIKRKSEALSVDYSVMPQNGPAQHCCISRMEMPHPDFEAAFAKMETLARRIIEMPLVVAETGELLKLFVRGVKFLEHKDKGYGIRINIEIDGFQNSEETLKVALPPYWAIAQVQQLTIEEVLWMDDLKEEAFEYAHNNKRAQVTLEEAAKEYEETSKEKNNG